MTELKPCPFCGGTPELVTRDVEPQGDPWYGRKNETFVLCDCGACLFDGAFHEGFWDAETRAVEAWNRRAIVRAASALGGELMTDRENMPPLPEPCNKGQSLIGGVPKPWEPLHTADQLRSLQRATWNAAIEAAAKKLESLKDPDDDGWDRAFDFGSSAIRSMKEPE